MSQPPLKTENCRIIAHRDPDLTSRRPRCRCTVPCRLPCPQCSRRRLDETKTSGLVISSSKRPNSLSVRCTRFNAWNFSLNLLQVFPYREYLHDIHTSTPRTVSQWNSFLFDFPARLKSFLERFKEILTIKNAISRPISRLYPAPLFRERLQTSFWRYAIRCPFVISLSIRQARRQ